MSLTMLQAVTSDLKSNYIARDEEIDLMAKCLVAEANMLMIGPPGTAKSSVFADFCARLEGRRRVFPLDKGSTPEKVLGPMSLREIREHDRYRYNTAGMLPDVEYAIIDEVFKGNGLTRDAMLQVLNEHQFMNGGIPETCPLIFCGASSNEYPEFNADGAFYDRFQVRVQVDYLPDHSQRMRMVRLSLARGRGLATDAEHQYPLEFIRQLQEKRAKVELCRETDDLAAQLYGNLMDQGIRVGDRRFAESFRLAQASAVIAGRERISPDDLLVFMHTAWSDPEERAPAQSAVMRVVNPEIADITEMFDQLEDGWKSFINNVKAAGEDHGKKLALHREFNQVASPNISKMQKIVLKMHEAGRDATRGKDLYVRAKARMEEASAMVFSDPVDDVA